MLHINDLTYRLGPRLLFDKASVAIPDGARVGFVGRNGTGKTTLFRLIRGEIGSEGGSITIGKGLRIGSVAQEAPAGPESLIDVVLAADTERATLLEEAETVTLTLTLDDGSTTDVEATVKEFTGADENYQDGDDSGMDMGSDEGMDMGSEDSGDN